MGSISVVIPTRGLVVAQCISSVLDEFRRSGVTSHIVIQDGLTIPDCFNIPIQNELTLHHPDYLWLVEEDVEVPRGGLQSLLAADNDITAIDYPLANGYGCVAYYKGKPMWCGTGCTLIKRRVFQYMLKPWFRTDINYLINPNGTFTLKEGIQNGYGGHDIHFCITARNFGFSLGVVPSTTASHYKLIDSGQKSDNRGVHTFVVHDHILHPHVLKGDPLDSAIFL